MWPSLELHLLPFRHGADQEPYLVLALLVLGVAAALGAGLWIALALRRDRTWAGPATAFAAGALLFLLYDLLKESASLGQGLVARPDVQLALLAAFVLGVLAMPALGRGGEDARGLAAAWTLGLAAHSAGEGWIVGTEAGSPDVIAPLQVMSFLLHKGVEGFTVPLVSALSFRLRHAAAVVFAVAGAALVGALAGLWAGPGYGPVFLFAAGAGAAAYALLRLGSLHALTLRQAAAFAAGVAFVYAAGVLHEL